MNGDAPAVAGSFRIRLIAFVLLAVVVVAAVVHTLPPDHLTIETGPENGSYYLDAQKYQQILAAQGIDLQIRTTPHSLEIVRDVGDPQSGVDAGFVAQDVSNSVNAPLASIGQVELQPLFIFANAELGRRTVLDDLRGRKIVLPPSDSATTDAALRVLQLYDITAENSSFSMLPFADGVKQLQEGRFDAGIFMVAPENPVVRALAADSSLHLVPIAEVKAISSHLPFLRPVMLPRGIYSIADAIPPDSTPMVAAPVGVVVRDNLHPCLVYALLEAMAKVHRAATFLGAAGEFPNMAGSQLAIHPLAQQYYKSGVPWSFRVLPPWLASAIDTDQGELVGIVLLVSFCIIAIWLADTVAVLLGAFNRSWRVARSAAATAPVNANDVTAHGTPNPSERT